MAVSSQYGNLPRKFPFGCQLRGGQKRSGFGDPSYRKRQGPENR